MMDFERILYMGRELEASDIHMTAGQPLLIRQQGRLCEAPLQPSQEETEEMLYELLNEEQKEQLRRGSDVDFAFQTEDGNRHRINIFREQDHIAAAVRLLNSHIPTLAELHLPEKLYELASEPRGLILVTGPTGSGKSTLVNLIPRFYDVTDGSIRLDGTDIREVTQHDLRDKLGYVPQKGLLFSGDIASNIMFGNPEGGGQEMKEAAQIAQATEFIEAKPNKYESPISQGGSNVSGGQKQRLSIARAIAKRPEVFIFDDSFSALDFKTDVALRKALKKRTKESTVLIVAQRISTILNAEQIIVLDDGKIAGIGTHKELLRNCEVYKQIAASQLSEKELQDGMQSEDRKTEDIKSETIKTEERKEAISAKTAEQEVRSDV